MQDISISVFKANCSRFIARVEKTGHRLRVLRRGQPVAEIIPTAPIRKGRFVLGDMLGTATIIGDIVSPVISEESTKNFTAKC
jgi:antitoxin (DNA-binding transcriptional repressor) of toxin-antitoxin stability system